MNISQRFHATAEDTERRAASLVFVLGIFFALAAVLSVGCCTDLQVDYIEANEAAHTAIMLDVKHGLYEPDDKSTSTLNVWAESNRLAREAAEAK